MNYAAVIKESVAAPELFRLYGFVPDRGGFIKCPFHSEKTGSMKIYPGAGGYHCFGCGAHGDVISFVRKYFNLSYPEALAKINDDFRLRLPLNKQLKHTERRKAWLEADRRRREYLERERERELLENAYSSVLDYWIHLDIRRMRYAPKTAGEPIHDLYADAVKRLDYAAYMLDQAETALYQYEHKEPLREVI